MNSSIGKKNNSRLLTEMRQCCGLLHVKANGRACLRERFSFFYGSYSSVSFPNLAMQLPICLLTPPLILKCPEVNSFRVNLLGVLPLENNLNFLYLAFIFLITINFTELYGT